MKTMKAIILAAGKGSRLVPLTVNRPKPSLKVADKRIIEHNLDQLNGLIDEAIIIVGYKSESIKDYIGDNFKGIKITYIFQKEMLGTGHAANLALDYVKDEFIILNGDDLYESGDIKKCIKKAPCVLVKEVEDPSAFGQFSVKEGKIVDLVEKPEKQVSNLINVGFYFLNKDMFDHEIDKSPRGEYEITDYLKNYIKEGKELHFAIAARWYPIGYPWSLISATEKIMDKRSEYHEGFFDAYLDGDCDIEGCARVGEGTIIKDLVKIEGPVIIGKNCIIDSGTEIKRFSVIGDGCTIKDSVIDNCMIGDRNSIKSGCLIQDSVTGSNCVLGENIKVLNTNEDGGTIKSMVKGELVDTGRKKFGCVLGDGVEIEDDVELHPGVKVWNDKKISKGEIVREDIK
jgi:UDP-N-acetylglucosamine diphosphorylase/glucosamine-1-phosphate N-acetyltransferase